MLIFIVIDDLGVVDVYSDEKIAKQKAKDYCGKIEKHWVKPKSVPNRAVAPSNPILRKIQKMIPN